MRITFVFYFFYLTVLLTSEDPGRWISASGNIPDFLRMLTPFAHLLSFTLLSLLAFVACLPIPRWGMLFILGIYGGLIEMVQAAVPYREPGWTDWIQDLCGITIGFIFFWLVIVFMRMMRGNGSLRIPGSS